MGPEVQQQNAQSWITRLHKRFLDLDECSWKLTEQGLSLKEKRSARKTSSIQVPRLEILLQLYAWFPSQQLTLCQS